MKICFVCDSYKPVYDGVVRYFDYFIPALVKAGHEVSLVCPKIPGTDNYEYPFEGFTVVRCFNPGFHTQGYWFALPDKRMYKAMKESDFVFIHSTGTLGIMGSMIAKAMNKKTGMFIHQDERIIMHNVLHTSRFMYNFAIIAFSQFIYGLFIDTFYHATERFKGKLLDYGVSENRISHTPFAIDDSRFYPENPKYDIRKRHGIPEDGIVSIYVGRLAREKNVANLIESMDSVMDENPNLYSLFVGKGPDWDHYSSFPYRNKERMIFTGFVPDDELQSHYVAADFFTSPSLNESSCFTVFEAMSCQIPVITSAYRHDPDIKHMENVLLVVDIANQEEIKDNILLLTRDDKLRKKIGKAGKKLVDSRNWDNHIQRFLKGVSYTLNEKPRNRIRDILKPKYPYLKDRKKKK